VSSFGGIQQALSSLQASQYGLQIVSQNISNASTPGYTRQGVDLAALDTVNGVPRRYVTGGDPSGVTVSATSRLNDPVVDARARVEHARDAQIGTATTQLGQIQDIFNEPSDTGLAAQLTGFWNDWANLANVPNGTSSGAARTVLLQDAGSLADTLNAMSQSLSDVAASTVNSLAGGPVTPGFVAGVPSYAQPTGGDLAQANTAATSLAALNQQIARGYNSSHDTSGNPIPGSPNYNGLLDQRDQLLSQLSNLVGGVATIGADGTATVRVGDNASAGAVGAYLVNGSQANTLEVNTAETDGSKMVAVYDSTASTTTSVTLQGGSAAASVTTLTSTTAGIPHFQTELDTVAQNLADTVNSAQWQGSTADGTEGAAIFGYRDGSGTLHQVTDASANNYPAAPIPATAKLAGVTASNIAITLTDPNGVAAAARVVNSGGTGWSYPVNNDGSNALAVSRSGSQSTSPDAAYATLVGDVGAQAQLSQQQQATQDAITAGVDSLRQSASGVNMDEEVSNMLVLQRTYQASSKILSVMDSMLDTLINQMGVG
jgi:flagellar hook-associated protein 1 FlgK